MVQISVLRDWGRNGHKFEFSLSVYSKFQTGLSSKILPKTNKTKLKRQTDKSRPEIKWYILKKEKNENEEEEEEK